jgi:hypothetical protein
VSRRCTALGLQRTQTSVARREFFAVAKPPTENTVSRARITTLYGILPFAGVFRVPKILPMPDAGMRNNDAGATPPDDSAQLFRLSRGRDEESESIRKISRWLDLADAALVVTPHRKQA